MNKKKFWKIIKKTIVRGGADIDERAEVLEKLLSKLKPDDIVKWQLILAEYLEVSKVDRLWAAAYLLNDGASDDGFDYFRAWLISLGEAGFLAILEDPDLLGELLQDGIDDDFLAEFEEIMYISSDVYLEKTGEDDEEVFFQACDQLALTTDEKSAIHADIILPEALEWDEDDDLESIFPKIARIKPE
ncbi:DUF4240 domain-containing protein [Listeria grandensis]|uniref:DUF4240 domain-containing protein n=1 Tax=Listeria grandensis TaxID=1494963 RepID=UPI00162441E0|nr:DUF4240 domain-containing protein [Listeria grandensis]MBC1475162.1 DUF4240 domain-containing protein [Listeria grandensis]